MTYEHSAYRGDKEYPINTTGDVVVGDAIRFERGVFGGSFREPVFLCFKRVTGVVVSDSYGEKTGQHTFTIRLEDGKTTRIMGRNLYKNGVWRQPWADENAREGVADEKHLRGDHVRSQRNHRQLEGHGHASISH